MHAVLMDAVVVAAPGDQFTSSPPEWRIERATDGAWHAAGPVCMSVCADADDARLFMRTGVKFGGRRCRWLVGQLAGVRVFLMGDQALITRRDLAPSVEPACTEANAHFIVLSNSGDAWRSHRMDGVHVHYRRDSIVMAKRALT